MIEVLQIPKRILKCESCKLADFEVEEFASEGQNPFYLCVPCFQRLLTKSLRPLEFFNLAAIHGHNYDLHDDFYDYDTGEATQPYDIVIDADKLPFPNYEDIKNDLNRLIDFSFVQYFTEDAIIKQIQKYEKVDVLKIIAEKVDYNRAINYKAYEIIAKVVGKTAKNWILKE